MELIADSVGVAGRRSPLLQPTSLQAPPSRVTLVAGNPGYAQAALALALGGRIPLATGRVTLDGDPSDELRRRHVALVDLPDVTAPEDGLAVWQVLAEDLAFAGRPCHRPDAETFLAGHLPDCDPDAPFEELDPADRVRILVNSAAIRPAVRVLVVCGPDRRGGDARAWLPDVVRLARGGLTVVMLVTHATTRQLATPVRYELGVAS